MPPMAKTYMDSRKDNTTDVYLSSKNTVFGQVVNGKLGKEGFNANGKVIVNDSYVDWDELQRSVIDASADIADASSETKTREACMAMIELMLIMGQM